MIITAQPRSSFALTVRRERIPWAANREFRILSIDGGGIRGIFPASILAELEQRYLNNASIVDYFDMVVGASTGGIIALGLGAGLSAGILNRIYIERGSEVFPGGALLHALRVVRSTAMYRYDRAGLSRLLSELLADQTLGDSSVRLCIPTFDGQHGEVYIFKTPHHPDYQLDRSVLMTTIGEAASAAPTFFRTRSHDGYRLVDGGIWANNPIMIGVVDALSCYDVKPDQIRILSLSCGDQRPKFGVLKSIAGLVGWWDVIRAAIDLQSQNVLGQAGLLIGPERLTRIAPNEHASEIALDDWNKARTTLPQDAKQALRNKEKNIVRDFLTTRADRFIACPS